MRLLALLLLLAAAQLQAQPLAAPAARAALGPLADWSGTPVAATAALPEGKPVIISFWASWCAPCVREMRYLKALHAQRGQQILIVGVNVDRPAGRARADEIAAREAPGYLLLRGDPDRVTAVTGEGGPLRLPRLVAWSADGRPAAFLTRFEGSKTRNAILDAADAIAPPAGAGP